MLPAGIWESVPAFRGSLRGTACYRWVSYGNARTSADHASRRGASSSADGEDSAVPDVTVDITVNGVPHRVDVPARTLLVHLLRDNLRLTGTHVGCDTTQCGACTVHLDGEAVKS